jgi:hypothetical protein
VSKNRQINFLSCYKAPNEHNTDFIDELENFVFSLDMNIPLFIVGDLNMDLLRETKH